MLKDIFYLTGPKTLGSSALTISSFSERKESFFRKWLGLGPGLYRGRLTMVKWLEMQGSQTGLCREVRTDKQVWKTTDIF